MKTLILVLIILVVFLVLLYFLVFNKSTITSPQKVNITNISYSIFNNSYISKTLNFTFTP